MTKFLLNLDEIEHVKRKNNIKTTTQLAQKTNISRSTWNRALTTKKPSTRTLNALAKIGARPSKILTHDTTPTP